LIDTATPENSLGSIAYLRFLNKCRDTVSIDLMGISLIILRKPYQGAHIKLNPYKEDGKIKGTIWRESRKEDGIWVKIKEAKSDKFTIGSDVAKSLYKYYYRGTLETPSLIHV
jgi:hypothetical protein